jgi:hypothetical protein
MHGINQERIGDRITMTQPHEVVTRRDGLAISGPVFREFTGKLANMEFPIENNRAKTRLQFTEMNVIRSVAAYTHPAGELVMNRTSGKGGQPSDRSPWGRLLISCDEQGYPDIMELLNKTLHMNSFDQIIEANAERNQEAGSFLIWTILSVDGVDSRPTPEEAAPPSDEAAPPAAGDKTEDDLLALIHGKTVGEFTSAAISLPMAGALRAKLLDANGLIPDWLTAGKVTTDGNIFTRVS